MDTRIKNLEFLDVPLAQRWVQVTGGFLLCVAIATPVVFLWQNSPRSEKYGALRPELRVLPVGSFSVSGSPLLEVSVTEVTQEQYQLVMGTNSSQFRGPNLPVENVTFIEAMRYCNHLSQLEQLPSCYDIREGYDENAKAAYIDGVNSICLGYRLPNLTEWHWITGNKSESPNAQPLKNSATGPQPVRLGEPENFSLLGLSGNVSEWIFTGQSHVIGLRSSSELNTRPFFQTSGIAGPNDEPIVVSGHVGFDIESITPIAVIRGGNWQGQRFNGSDYTPEYRSSTLGFRIVRTRR